MTQSLSDEKYLKLLSRIKKIEKELRKEFPTMLCIHKWKKLEGTTPSKGCIRCGQLTAEL